MPLADSATFVGNVELSDGQSIDTDFGALERDFVALKQARPRNRQKRRQELTKLKEEASTTTGNPTNSLKRLLSTSRIFARIAEDNCPVKSAYEDLLRTQ